MITPAISVSSAVEGLKLATPALEHYVVALTIFILVVLFAVQSSGTARVASAFGPVMIAWFASLAVMGFVHIADDPSVLPRSTHTTPFVFCSRTAPSAW